MRAQPHQNIYLFLDDLPNVILGLIIDASFFRSAKAAKGRPQFATIFSKRIQVFFQIKEMFKNSSIYVVPKNADEIDFLKQRVSFTISNMLKYVM
jgi:hypothetical protein